MGVTFWCTGTGEHYAVRAIFPEVSGLCRVTCKHLSNDAEISPTSALPLPCKLAIKVTSVFGQLRQLNESLI